MDYTWIGSDILIGSADREAALEQLREFYASGHLTEAELASRLDAALAARTQNDIVRALNNLPWSAPVPAVQAAPVKALTFTERWYQLSWWITLPVTITWMVAGSMLWTPVAAFTTWYDYKGFGWPFWPALAAALASLLGGGSGFVALVETIIERN